MRSAPVLNTGINPLGSDATMAFSVEASSNARRRAFASRRSPSSRFPSAGEGVCSLGLEVCSGITRKLLYRPVGLVLCEVGGCASRQHPGKLRFRPDERLGDLASIA